jgi:hypothetical protein
MTTNATILGDALRLVGVIAEGQSVSAEQGLNGLRYLNQMMATWEEDGVSIGYFAQSATTDSIPVPDWAEKGVTSKLAQRWQADYPSQQLPAWVLDNAQNGVGLIERKCMVESLKPARMDTVLPSGEGWIGSRSRILTGD